MDKTTEVVMGWVITAAIPIIVLQIQEMILSRKHRIELSLKQARRDEAISNDISMLKSTVDRSATVLENLKDDMQDVRERLVRVETKVSP